MNPLTTPQAVKDAAVKIARAPKMWTPEHRRGFFHANEIHREAGEAIALSLERLPIAPDDRDEKIRKAVAMLQEARLQIEYLDAKFQPTSTSAATLARIEHTLTELTGSQKP